MTPFFVRDEVEVETQKSLADTFFGENQALESKVRKAQRAQKEAMEERARAVEALEKQQEKSKRDTEKIINLKARLEAIENRHANEVNALKREKEKAMEKQAALQEQMMELMEKWEEQTQVEP